MLSRCCRCSSTYDVLDVLRREGLRGLGGDALKRAALSRSRRKKAAGLSEGLAAEEQPPPPAPAARSIAEILSTVPMMRKLHIEAAVAEPPTPQQDGGLSLPNQPKLVFDPPRTRKLKSNPKGDHEAAYFLKQIYTAHKRELRELTLPRQGTVIRKQVMAEFDGYKARGMAGSETYSAVLEFLLLTRSTNDADVIIAEMNERGIIRNPAMYVLLIRYYAIKADWDAVESCHRRCVETKWMNRNLWIAVLSGYASILSTSPSGPWRAEKQQEVFRLLGTVDLLSKDIVSYNAALQACFSVADCQRVLDAITARGLEPDTFTFHMLLKAAARIRCFVLADEVLKRAVREKLLSAKHLSAALLCIARICTPDGEAGSEQTPRAPPPSGPSEGAQAHLLSTPSKGGHVHPLKTANGQSAPIPSEGDHVHPAKNLNAKSVPSPSEGDQVHPLKNASEKSATAPSKGGHVPVSASGEKAHPLKQATEESAPAPSKGDHVHPVKNASEKPVPASGEDQVHPLKNANGQSAPIPSEGDHVHPANNFNAKSAPTSSEGDHTQPLENANKRSAPSEGRPPQNASRGSGQSDRSEGDLENANKRSAGRHSQHASRGSGQSEPDRSEGDRHPRHEEARQSMPAARPPDPHVGLPSPAERAQLLSHLLRILSLFSEHGLSVDTIAYSLILKTAFSLSVAKGDVAYNTGVLCYKKAISVGSCCSTPFFKHALQLFMKYGDHDSVVAAAQDAAASGISIRTVVRAHKMAEEVDSFFQSLGKDTPQAFHHGTAVSVYAERKPAS